MRFRVIGPHTINGCAPGEEFDYEPGAPGWTGEDPDGRPLHGAPFNINQWLRPVSGSPWVEVVEDTQPQVETPVDSGDVAPEGGGE